MKPIDIASTQRRTTIIQHYFSMWLTRDFSKLKQVIATDCYYQECYGPAYCSLAEIQTWIQHQLTVQRVIVWQIQQIWTATDGTMFVQWNFEAQTQRLTVFDGLSSIHFNSANQIDDLREYQTTTQHTYPYH
ncbi:nuclear transport factor 2 family protein [Lactiplantibacillus pentosus]|uniref:nuclear transport factor 2 family protein n=1 Tax=Lactiplantibacillus pentosus TaxID=1589 RepID=UPI003C2D0AEA